MPTQLIIDRTKWRRAGGQQPVDVFGMTRLLNNKGYMCCLGFDALACGYTPEELLERMDPEGLVFSASLKPGYENRVEPVSPDKAAFNHGLINSKLVREAIHINDDDSLTDEQREEMLTPVLKALGWDEVIFIN